MPYALGHRRERARDRGLGHRCHSDGARDRRRDRGQVAIEYLGFIPVLMLVAVAVIQIGLVAWAAQQAGTAARAGARAASLGMSAQQGCQEAVADSLSGRTRCSQASGGGTVTVVATVRIPSIIPLWDPIGDAHKTATMPLDR
ncbi:TadE/TadG family type IV pilus assembly protein [Streptomyces anandii]|uniref:TadE/TadG family type IV pilus assembly protein n=1 Tax=Streptomyces anandii TaxID=285454 RepID=A0ABW6HD69_9ACTN